jgi:hypothetical protein
MKWAMSAFLAAGVVGTAAASSAFSTRAPVFGPARAVVSVQTSDGLQETAATDLNGDGNADVIVTRIEFQDPKPVPVTVLAGDGKGHFLDKTAGIFAGAVPEPVFPRRTVIADFNGDGRPDVFIADTGTDSAPFPGYPNTLILSAPGGKLVDASSNLPRAADFTHSAAAADVNGDGTIDLYAGNLVETFDGGTDVPPEILLNDGSGRFRTLDSALPADMTSPYAPHYDGAALVDANGDGSPDLVLAGSPGNPNRLLLNDGHGHFTDLPGALPGKPWGVDSEGLAITPIDLNNDGHLDLLVGYTKNHPFYVGRWIQVLINNGAGMFRDETSTRLPQNDNSSSWPYRIQVVDLNGDGKPDIGVSLFGYQNETPPFYLNKGDGTFASMPARAFKTDPLAMFTFLDANRDGRVDILSTSPSGGGSPENHLLALQVKPKPPCKPKPHHRCR